MELVRSNKKIMYKSKRKNSDSFLSYLMLAPQIFGFLVFTLYPLIWAIRLSWFSYDGTISTTRFIGWDNFINIFTNDKSYWQCMLNTFYFALLKIPIELPMSLLLALLLSNKMVKFRGFFRAMYFLPHIISVAIIGLIFNNIFTYFGVVNGLLTKWGIIHENIDWFVNKNTAMAVLVTASIWQTFGINVLYFLAALMGIPEELYECAKLDGANKYVVFFKITLPMMAPVAQVILMLSLVGTLQVNDLVLVLTNGAPGGQTFTVMPYLVSNFVPGFAGMKVNIGYGCALSVVTAAIFGLITLIYNKISNKMSSLY